ncbi:MAG TPA: hypothetical protein VMU92_05365 [Acidobacteriaceae bacterium]|nr:hypothetical protein [Acidobacteriaceae bacterium]
MTEANTFMNYTDADLRATMRRAMWITAILAVLGAIVLTIAAGWQTAALFVSGAVVSVTGIYEWQQLIALVNAKLDNQQPPRATGFTVVMFLLRLAIAGLIIYASLRWFHGSLYALLSGLGLAVIALTFEALRTLRFR